MTDNACIAKQHQYPISFIFTVVSLLLSAVAFRAVEKIFTVFNSCKIPIFEYFKFLPSWKSAQSWFLRYGLYRLSREKEKANDWIVIVDFKVQAGLHKCLIILGVRWNTLELKQKMRGSFDIRHEDFEPLALIPMVSSNGEKVAQVLEEISLKTTPFMQIIADHGGDVNKGIKLYCENHSATVNTYDITHKIAILLKNELEKDEIWKEIIQCITNTKQKTKQTTEACLSPPRQRDKARFMNVDIIVDWLQETLWFLHNGKEVPYLDKNILKEKLGWILDYNKVIEEYVTIIEIIRFARHQVRTEGLHRRSYLDFFKKMKVEYAEFFKGRKSSKLVLLEENSRPIRLAKNIIKFLKQEGMQIPVGKRMLGSSEGIESIIGREKIIVERTKSTSSITRCVLAIPAMTGECDRNSIQKALESISVKDLYAWEKTWIGKSDLAKRREIFNDNLVSEPLSNLAVGFP